MWCDIKWFQYADKGAKNNNVFLEFGPTARFTLYKLFTAYSNNENTVTHWIMEILPNQTELMIIDYHVSIQFGQEAVNITFYLNL